MILIWNGGECSFPQAAVGQSVIFAERSAKAEQILILRSHWRRMIG
jgi:hypothetical protein